MSVSAEILFDKLKAAIAQSVEEESFATVTSVAEKAAMVGGRKDPNLMTLGFTFGYTDASGDTVELVVKSYDTSSPFQIKPDRNKMTVELVRDGKTLQTYSDYYED